MLSFELDGDEQTLRRFLSGLSLFTLAESLGGVGKPDFPCGNDDACRHGAWKRVPPPEFQETLLRISTGIEDGEDLIADLENGFRAANEE